MTREDVLAYIAVKFGSELAQVGLLPVDTPESLLYVIYDALMKPTEDEQKAEADRCVAVLIHDRQDMLGITVDTDTETDSPPAVEDEE